MDKAMLDSIVSAIVSATVPAILAALDTPKVAPETPKVAPVEIKSTKSIKARVIKPEADFDLVKAYVLARKSGKLASGPWVVSYNKMSAESTFANAKASSATALSTISKDAEKLRKAFPGVKF